MAKPPASLWVMELSARIFGVNNWSILTPQALAGVAAVGLLYAMVRRHAGHAAGLIAGAVLALTPVAALMFRFNNPDALLVLLLVGSAYATTRAIEAGKARWLVLAGVLIGFGFVTKMLQAFLVLPAFGTVYLLAAPVSLRRRLMHLLAGAAAVVASVGWWVALVTLWPASDRPYIGGSTDNSVLNLIFGYNGFGRITGSETGSVGGTGAAGSMWGPTGIARLFNASFGGQVSWLIPAALILLGAALWLRWHRPRTDRLRAGVLLWGGWLVITGLVFSFAEGIIHPYYTVALAPAIGALVGMGAVLLWRDRDRLAARCVLAATVLVTAVWAYVLLDRSPTWLPWLRVVVLLLGLGGTAALLALPWLRRWMVPAAAVIALAAVLAGPAAYAIDTAATPHSGAIPSAGPAALDVTGLGGGPGGPAAGRIGGLGGPPGGGFVGGPGSGAFAGGLPPRGNPPSGALPVGNGAQTGTAPGGATAGGGLLNASTPSAALTQALEKNAGAYEWVAATIGANNAAGYQLATGDAVMAIGGFNGTDQWPSLAMFEQLVTAGKIHYFIPGGAGGGASAAGTGVSSAITNWVEQHYSATNIGGTTVYDLSAATAG